MVITLSGFHHFRGGKGGGGIVAFVKEKWLVLKHEIYFSHAETIALSIESDDFDFFLACYRPPSQSVICFLDEVNNILRRLNNRGQFCLAGDINIDIAK